jgi:uncharacterized RDD family membrane protein YckC
MSDTRYAGLWIRGLALLLDWLVFCAVFFPVTRVVKGVWLMRADDHDWTYGELVFDPLCLTFLIVIIAYYVMLEGFFGVTVGKMIVRIRVVGVDGERIGLARSVVRNALRLVDGLPALNIVGIVLILTSPQKARFGDLVARTRVVHRGNITPF